MESDAAPGKCRYAVLRIPVNAACPRFVEMPSSPGCHDIIFVDDIIRLCLNNIFFMSGAKQLVIPKIGLVDGIIRHMWLNADNLEDRTCPGLAH